MTGKLYIVRAYLILKKIFASYNLCVCVIPHMLKILDINIGQEAGLLQCYWFRLTVSYK